MKPAIILSTHTMGLGVIRALGMKGVPIIALYYDNADMGYVSKYVEESIKAPHPGDFGDQFIELLIEIAPRFDRGLLIPSDDLTLATVSKYKNLLVHHYIVACTDWQVTEKLIDKKHTYTLADAIGVPAPRTMVPHSKEDIERYHQMIEYPCLIKPCRSQRYFDLFGVKMVEVNNFDQMLANFEHAAHHGLEVLLQEIIPGDDSQGVNYNSYFWDGVPHVEFTAQQIRNAPPEFGSPRVVVSKQIPEVLELGRKILKAMGFYGYSCTEFKKDARDGSYKLMEVNGRHNRSGLLAVRCGMNFPWIQYKHLVMDTLPSTKDFQSGVFWIDITRDLIYSITSRNKEKDKQISYFQPYRQPHVFAVFDLSDPKPFIHRCMDIIRKAISAVFSKVMIKTDTGGVYRAH